MDAVEISPRAEDGTEWLTGEEREEMPMIVPFFEQALWYSYNGNPGWSILFPRVVLLFGRGPKSPTKTNVQETLAREWRNAGPTYTRYVLCLATRGTDTRLSRFPYVV